MAKEQAFSIPTVKEWSLQIFCGITLSQKQHKASTSYTSTLETGTDTLRKCLDGAVTLDQPAAPSVK
ncbi:hypothetical protein F2P79_009405 [Pimephales promelas]|nr:hypothetical protein F2P79_009405 [Pimephales promelas]